MGRGSTTKMTKAIGDSVRAARVKAGLPTKKKLTAEKIKNLIRENWGSPIDYRPPRHGPVALTAEEARKLKQVTTDTGKAHGFFGLMEEFEAKAKKAEEQGRDPEARFYRATAEGMRFKVKAQKKPKEKK